MYNFRILSINSLRNYFLNISFSYFTPEVRLFFVEKRKPKLFGLKNVMEREIRKILTFVIC